MDEFSYQKTPKRAAQAAVRKTTSKGRSIPNSGYLNSLGASEGASLPELEAKLRARQPAVPRPQAQIPSAEAEADRLSTSVFATTPEGIKAEMGRRLGADFSGIRLHADGAAAARAAVRNARAFTAGGDVYFGPGGFDPGIAAHELVHTAQQGAVTGAAVAASAPMGGVQMWPWGKKKKPESEASAAAQDTAPEAPAGPSRTERFKGWLKKTGRTIASGADRAWDYTGGRLARWNREAVEEYTQAQDNGDWNVLSKGEKAKWALHNPLAWMRAQRKGVKDDARARMRTYNEDTEFARSFLTGHGTGQKSSLIGGDLPSEDEDKSGGTKELLEGAADQAGTLLSKTVGDTAGTVSDIGKGVYDVADAWGEQKEQASQGLNGAANRTRAGMVSSILDIGSNAGGLFDGAAAEATSGIFGTASSVVNAGVGIHQALSGRKQRTGSKAIQRDVLGGGTREDLSDDDLFMHDVAVQSAMEGRNQEIQGTGSAISGALDAASGVADLTGVGAGVGTALKGAKAVVNGGTAVASGIQHGRIKAKVSEQTLGLNDDMIQQVMAARSLENTAANRRRAKRAILRSQGYSSGFREELYRDQTVKRGTQLSQMATSARNKASADLTDNDRRAMGMMGAMSVDAVDQEVEDPSTPGSTVKRKGYSSEGAIKALGLSGGAEDLQKLRDRTRGIAAKARARRAKARLGLHSA